MGRNADDRYSKIVLHSPKGTYGKITAGADINWDEDMPFILTVDPTADGRKLIMPAITEPLKGHWFILANAADAAENILVRSPADAATLGTVAQNETAFVWNDGVAWFCGVMAQT